MLKTPTNHLLTSLNTPSFEESKKSLSFHLINLLYAFTNIDNFFEEKKNHSNKVIT